MNITSRTESMIGACGHAEEWVMKRGRDASIKLSETDIYVAGVDSYGMPWIKTEPVHTCLRCSVQMNYAEIGIVNVPVINQWESISTKEAVVTAARYALKDQKV